MLNNYNSKVIIIGDCHFGIRGSNPIYFKYFESFYTDLFKYIDENNIDTIIQLGDLVDKRKSIDFLALYHLKKLFLTPCENRSITLYIISGNHDCYYKSTNEINSVRLLQTPNMVVFDGRPGTDSINGVDFDFYPWIHESLVTESLEYMTKSKSKFAVGHFEFKNFRLNRLQLAESGMDHTVCSNYALVFSGHFHTISRRSNILYTGTPYELDWADCGDRKGFWVLDTESDELEFIHNPHTLYKKVEYDEKLQENLIPDIESKFVKLTVKNKTDQYAFDSYFKTLMSMKPHDVQIIDDEIAKSVQKSMKTEIEFQSTPDMINFVIDSMDISLDKLRLKNTISEVFTEAQELAKL